MCLRVWAVVSRCASSACSVLACLCCNTGSNTRVTVEGVQAGKGPTWQREVVRPNALLHPALQRAPCATGHSRQRTAPKAQNPPTTCHNRLDKQTRPHPRTTYGGSLLPDLGSNPRGREMVRMVHWLRVEGSPSFIPSRSSPSTKGLPAPSSSEQTAVSGTKRRMIPLWPTPPPHDYGRAGACTRVCACVSLRDRDILRSTI